MPTHRQAILTFRHHVQPQRRNLILGIRWFSSRLAKKKRKMVKAKKIKNSSVRSTAKCPHREHRSLFGSRVRSTSCWRRFFWSRVREWSKPWCQHCHHCIRWLSWIIFTIHAWTKSKLWTFWREINRRATGHKYIPTPSDRPPNETFKRECPSSWLTSTRKAFQRNSKDSWCYQKLTFRSYKARSSRKSFRLLPWTTFRSWVVQAY